MKIKFYLLVLIITLANFNKSDAQTLSLSKDTFSFGESQNVVGVTTGVSLWENFHTFTVSFVGPVTFSRNANSISVDSFSLYIGVYSSNTPGTYNVRFTDSLGIQRTFPNAFVILPEPVPTIPTPIFPANGQTLTSTYFTFDWDDQLGEVFYSIELSSDSTFSGIYYTKSFSYYNSISELPSAGYVRSGETYWHIKATNFYTGDTSAFSQTRSFEVIAQPRITNALPNTTYAGENDFKLNISGMNTHFELGSSTLSSYLQQEAVVVNPYKLNPNGNQFLESWYDIPSNAPLGLYDLIVSNTIDDTLTLYKAVTISGGNSFSGKVFLDKNSNGVFDGLDVPYSMAFLKASPYNVIADSQGNFSGYLPTGNFVLSVGNLMPQLNSVPSSYSLSFPGIGDSVINKDFAIQIDSTFHDLQIGLYSGSVARRGNSDALYLHYKNKGPLDESGQVKFLPAQGLVLDSVSDANYSLSGDTLIWNFSGLGFTQSQVIKLNFSVPLSIPLGSNLNFNAWIEGTSGSDYTPGNNVDYWNQTVLDSYDPNNKTVSSENFSSDLIASGLDLTYSIQFQNTGNDTAYNISIIDTLSPNVDLSSIEVLGASANYRIILYPDRVVEFRFDNINLLDSNSNEPLSHGYISYRVKTLTTLSLQDIILNTAYIYFDHNAPVVTNTCITTISVGVEEIFEGSTKIQINPNPVSSGAVISYEFEKSGQVLVQIFDYQGRIVKTLFEGYQNNGLQELRFDASELNSGIYFISVKCPDGIMKKKFVQIK